MRATTCLEYLGILLDSSALEARLPLDTFQDIRAALQQWASCTESSKHDLQFLCSITLRSNNRYLFAQQYVRFVLLVFTHHQSHKGVYIDGHERVDVVEYRKLYLRKLEILEATPPLCSDDQVRNKMSQRKSWSIFITMRAHSTPMIGKGGSGQRRGNSQLDRKAKVVALW